MQMKRNGKKTRSKSKQRAAKQAEKDLWQDLGNSNNHHSSMYGFRLGVGSVEADVVESRTPLRKRSPQCSGTQVCAAAGLQRHNPKQHRQQNQQRQQHQQQQQLRELQQQRQQRRQQQKQQRPTRNSCRQVPSINIFLTKE